MNVDTIIVIAVAALASILVFGFIWAMCQPPYKPKTREQRNAERLNEKSVQKWPNDSGEPRLVSRSDVHADEPATTILPLIIPVYQPLPEYTPPPAYTLPPPDPSPMPESPDPSPSFDSSPPYDPGPSFDSSPSSGFDSPSSDNSSIC